MKTIKKDRRSIAEFIVNGRLLKREFINGAPHINQQKALQLASEMGGTFERIYVIEDYSN